MIDRSRLTWREHALYLGDELLAQIVPDPITRRRITPRPWVARVFYRAAPASPPPRFPWGSGAALA